MIKRLEQTLEDFARRRIQQFQFYNTGRFAGSYLVSLSKESPLANELLKEQMFGKKLSLEVHENRISFDSDLSLAENEFIELSDYQITPGLVMYDDSLKKVSLVLAVQDFNCRGVYLGKIIGNLGKLKKFSPHDAELKGTIYLDQVMEHFIKILFVGSAILFLKEASYSPQRCTEEFISNEENLKLLDQNK